MVLAALALSLAPKALPSYQFEIDAERTFTKGSLTVRLWTSGQMVGDFHSQRNPGGTRTAAGDGPVADTVNEPVLAKTVWNLEATGEFHSAGTFTLELDHQDRKAHLTGYRIERLAEGPVQLQGHYTVIPAPFRTVAPDTGWNVDEALGRRTSVSLLRLRIAQTPGSRTGTLTPIENGWTRVSINFMATVVVDLFEFDQEAAIEFPIAASLVGNLRTQERTAEFGYPLGEGGDNLARQVHLPLQDFQIYLTHPSQGQAGFRIHQTVDRFGVSLSGLRQFSARGVLSGPG